MPMLASGSDYTIHAVGYCRNATQHAQHHIHLLARGKPASLCLRFRHEHLHGVSKEIVGRRTSRLSWANDASPFAMCTALSVVEGRETLHSLGCAARTKVSGILNIPSRLFEDDAGPGGFHLEDLQGIVDAFCRVVQNQA